MTVYQKKVIEIFDKHEMLRTYVNSVANSVDNCSNDTPSEMRLAKGHLDYIYYARRLMDTNEYNTINDLLGEIGVTFKKCNCR